MNPEIRTPSLDEKLHLFEDTIDFIQSCVDYVPEYFKDKHKVTKQFDEVRKNLARAILGTSGFKLTAEQKRACEALREMMPVAGKTNIYDFENASVECVRDMWILAQLVIAQERP